MQSVGFRPALMLVAFFFCAAELPGQVGQGSPDSTMLIPALPPPDRPAPAPGGEPLHSATYVEVTGDDRLMLHAREWETPYGYFLESVSSSGDRHVVLVDTQLQTIAWRFENEKLGTVEQVRHSDVWAGEQPGEPLWLQSIERALRRFVLNGAPGDRLRFSVVQPDTLSSRRLEARIMGDEDVTVSGATVRARRVRISLPGIGVVIWRSNYWFRLPDGLFVLSRATRGPPGTPETVVMLTAERND